MAPVTPITRYRAVARHDIPLDVPKGDSDLLPIAVFLWLCSALRVALTGKSVGMGMFDAMAILGKDATLVRLDRAIANA